MKNNHRQRAEGDGRLVAKWSQGFSVRLSARARTVQDLHWCIMVTYLNPVYGLFLRSSWRKHTEYEQWSRWIHTVYHILMNGISVAVVEMLDIQKRNTHKYTQWRENFVGPLSHALTIEAVHLMLSFQWMFICMTLVIIIFLYCVFFFIS